jgi:UDP-GlcNAc:undecaprenyl-phosphate GlcNAc-1-phosphate transferase
MAAGLTHRQAVLVLYGLCVVLGAAALILTYASSGQSALLLIVLALVALVFLRSLGYMRFDRVSASAVDRKRNRALRGALRPLGRRLRQVRATEEMWPIVVEAAGIVEATGVRLRSETPGAAEADAFSHGFAVDGDPPEGVRFVVPGGKGSERVLELAWPDGRREVDRDTEIAIDIFCEHLGDALELLSSVPVGLRAERAAKPRA